MEAPEDSPLRKDLAEIRSAAALTRQLLAFSRRQILHPKPVDVNETVDGIVKMLGRVIGEHIKIEVELTQGLRLAMADTAQVEQVIMNLAVNARDAMPGGGTLSIKTAEVDLDEEYVKSAPGANVGSYIMLELTDTGCGMSSDVVERIFEPFFTTKENGKGTGLGLATVYGIVKQHGGFIQVESQVGKGSVFTIYLPVVSDEKPSGARAEESEAPSRGTETILLVEDQEEVRNVARRMLTSLGYQVVAAVDGREAIEKLLAHKGEVHLILTDVVMPGMSGPELEAEAARLRPGLKVLFMSGYSDMALIDQSRIPEERLLTKPFTTEQIARKVRRFLDM